MSSLANSHANRPRSLTTQRRPFALRVPVPRSLLARFTLILLLGLVLAQLLTFMAVRIDRGGALRDLMTSNIKRDIASSMAILDRLPSEERSSWLLRLERPNYRFEIDRRASGTVLPSSELSAFSDTIGEAMQTFKVEKIVQAPQQPKSLQIQARLTDGTLLLVHAQRLDRPVSSWVTWVPLVQLLVVAGFGWYAVRLATRPFAQLADAADNLGPDLKTQRLAERGPTEVAHAARAFNAMQRRIAGYMAEHVEILASISHDLQTPITRMQLRLELMDNKADQQTFRRDLDAMHALVREGVTYAHTLHGTNEPDTLLDVDALLGSIVADYQDMGQVVLLEGWVGMPLFTRPNALRRILTNLVDNGLKYSDGAVRIQSVISANELLISVIDHGPGIPPERLDAVLKPFYRLEGTKAAGTGLGLAIAHQLAQAISAKLTLRNRADGGLEVGLMMALQPHGGYSAPARHLADGEQVTSTVHRTSTRWPAGLAALWCTENHRRFPS